MHCDALVLKVQFSSFLRIQCRLNWIIYQFSNFSEQAEKHEVPAPGKRPWRNDTVEISGDVMEKSCSQAIVNSLRIVSHSSVSLSRGFRFFRDVSGSPLAVRFTIYRLFPRLYFRFFSICIRERERERCNPRATRGYVCFTNAGHLICNRCKNTAPPLFSRGPLSAAAPSFLLPVSGEGLHLSSEGWRTRPVN